MASLASADRASLQGRRVIPRQAPPGNGIPSDIDFPLFVDGQQGPAQNGIIAEAAAWRHFISSMSLGRQVWFKKAWSAVEER